MIPLVLLACAGPPDPAGWTPTVAVNPWPREAGEPIPLPALLAGETWLQDTSGYGQEGVSGERSGAGSWGLGNRRVFGLVGLDRPWNTLTNLIGPGYQRTDGFFGDTSVWVALGGAPVEPTEEQVERPRGTLVVRTLARSGDVAWSTTDLAPPGQDLLSRLVTVWNEGAEPLSGASLRLRVEGGDLEPDGAGVIQVRGPRRMRLSCDGSMAVADGVEVPIPEVEPMGQWSALCTLAFTAGEVFPAPSGSFADQILASRQVTTAFLDRALSLEVPDPKVADLWEGLLLTELAQTTESGLVSPMNRYTSGWLRDAEGPVRLFLGAGLHEEVQTLLSATVASLGMRGAISNSFSTDLDLDAWEEPADPEAFWGSVGFMPGRNAAEAPSHPVLFHALTVAWTGDDALLDANRVAFLRACLERQDVDQEGLLPFSGDETFRLTLALATDGRVPEEHGSSALSSMLLATAARWLGDRLQDGDLAELADRVEGAAAIYWTGQCWSPLAEWDTGVPWPAPFEDVSLQPTWLGWLPPDHPLARLNLESAVDGLLGPEGLFLTRESVTGGPITAFTGMVPGFGLHALALARHPQAALAFDALDGAATPSGHFEELHAADGSPMDVTHSPDGLGDDVPARYRPWEGGIVGAALLQYLVGPEPDGERLHLSLSPHLPHGWPSLGARGLRMGEGRLDLEVRSFDEGLAVGLVRDGAGPGWTVDLALDRPCSSAWVDGVPHEVTSGSPCRVEGVQVPPGREVGVVVE